MEECQGFPRKAAQGPVYSLLCPSKAWPGLPDHRFPRLWVEGAPHLSLGLMWLHHLHHLSLLHQDDLGVPQPGDVQGLSRDECTHACGSTLQPLWGEKAERVRAGRAPAPQVHAVQTEELLEECSERGKGWRRMTAP